MRQYLLDDQNNDIAVTQVESPPMTSPELSKIVRSFASVLLGQAVADGEVQDIEMRRIEGILRRTFYIAEADVKRLVREALNESVQIGSLAFENALEVLRERFLPHQLERFQEALSDVAESDGSVDNREQFFAAYVGKRLAVKTTFRAN